jgi:hypothetical protein
MTLRPLPFEQLADLIERLDRIEEQQTAVKKILGGDVRARLSRHANYPIARFRATACNRSRQLGRTLKGLLLGLLVVSGPAIAADQLVDKPLPASCHRLHVEQQKCEVGRRSCNQHTVDRWRQRCKRDLHQG